MERKSSSNSRTVKTAGILPPDANAYGTLFGGKLMAHIDDVAAISAMRHARKLVVTASTDSVDFLQPVKVGDTIILEGFVTAAYTTSMEVLDRKSTRLNSSHVAISYAVFCLKKQISYTKKIT